MIVAQTNSKALADHHRVTQRVMNPVSETCKAIYDRAKGGQLTECLLCLRDYFQSISFADQNAERPHAQLTHIGSHTNASKFPFDSATMRLNQNCIDKVLFTEHLKCDWQKYWNGVKQVVQFGGRNRPVKMRWRKVVEMVYFFRPDLKEVAEMNVKVSRLIVELLYLNGRNKM